MADYRHVQGGDVIARVLRGLPAKFRKDYMRQAVVAGAREVRDEARKNHRFTNRTGRLERNIIIKFIPKASGPFLVTYFVLVRSGKKFQAMRGKRLRKGVHGPVQAINNDAYYWRFVEFGTKKMKAQSFMRKAFEEKKDKALGLITDLLRKGIDQSVRALKV